MFLVFFSHNLDVLLSAVFLHVFLHANFCIVQYRLELSEIIYGFHLLV